MKKKIIVVFALVLVLFNSLFFCKDMTIRVLLKETAVEFLQGEEQSITVKKGDYVIFGKYLDEPVVWFVADIEKGRPLLQSAYVITFKAFDSSGDGEDDIKMLGSSDFDTSALKRWLNSTGTVKYESSAPDEKNVFNGINAYDGEEGFLCEKNFTPQEKNLIDTEGVFLFSKKQISELLPGKKRIKTPTKSAVIQDESPYIFLTSKGIWYWTSTPSDTNRTGVVTVTASGSFYRAPAFDGVTGVCPAVYLKSDKLISVRGDGSEEKPYVIRRVG